MAANGLTAFWIRSPIQHAPLGFGVTGWSLHDALQIIRALDFARFVPENLAELTVTPNITVADLDQPHVVANMGPIVVRGMWYPFIGVGVPKWAKGK